MSIPPLTPDRLDPKRAGAAALSGYFIWGLSPIFYKFLAFANPSEIVLWRAIWSAPVLLLLLYMGRRIGPAFAVLNDRKTLLVMLATSLLIAANWWLFIFAVNSGRVLEVSLGYFINPLMVVAVGVFVARERFGPLRAVAVGLAVLGVINQVITVGELPWLALVLAGSFTAYGYVRKTIQVDARIGLFWETVIIAIPSMFVLSFLEIQGGANAGHFLDGPYETILLMMTGPMTVAPLLLFLLGARGLTFATIGVLQFIAPTLQFIVGLVYGEPFSVAYLFTFIFIWSGLAVFVFDLLHFERKQKRAGIRPA